MAPFPEIVPTAIPLVTWVVPLHSAPALVELLIGLGLVGALAILQAAARAIARWAAVERPMAWHWFRAFQA